MHCARDMKQIEYDSGEERVHGVYDLQENIDQRQKSLHKESF